MMLVEKFLLYFRGRLEVHLEDGWSSEYGQSCSGIRLAESRLVEVRDG
jgi:hypothetical protein